MSKNPFLNALTASAYIAAVAATMQFLISRVGESNGVLVPIIMLSMFTLSAAVMGYIFLFEPAQAFLSGKKQEALTLFFQTLGIFGAITILIILLKLWVL